MRRALAALCLGLALGACDGPAGTGGGGPFAFLGSGTQEVTLPDAAPGSDLPFGQVARACGVSGGELGSEVARAPAEGRARYRLYDTAPGGTGPRAQYITGFDDGCPRQITAALVTFGTAGVHERTRYKAANAGPFSPTDAAYETIKSRVCGVRERSPCPEDRLPRLDRELAFVTAYPRFGASNRRLELLLHDGELAAETHRPR